MKTKTKKPKAVIAPKPLPVEPEITPELRETFALNSIMASTVEKAFNMAVDTGATIANPSSSATKIANVDSLPKIQFLAGDQLNSEAYKAYTTKPIVIQARKLTQPEVLNTIFGTIHGNVGQYRIISKNGQHSFMDVKQFEDAYQPL
jgi:hypothetical protein